MSRLLPVSGREMCKILEMIGFQKVHQVGSHARYAHPDGRKTVVPVHGNEELSTGLDKRNPESRVGFRVTNMKNSWKKFEMTRA